MKKIILIICILFLFVLFPKNNEVKAEKEELRGIFISYIEEQRYLSKDQEKSKANINKMIENVKKNKFNLIILQVRSASDAIYDSNIFPWSSVLTGVEGEEYFDVLDYFIKESHSNNIKLYAWINPYRVRTNTNVESISDKNPAYKYLDTDTIYINNGIYYNPSKKEVEDLIVNGVEEIVKNYEVDGILFDDYFYPDDQIDINDYNEYIKTNPNINLKDYHLMIVNKMVKRTHEICEKYKVEFGISPDGNINNNYESIYADIYTWLNSDEYIDYIMPQIYYGFFNEKMPFYQTIKEWDNAIKNNSIKLMIALALYKSGNVDKYAKSGSEEWIKNNDIIKREIMLSRNLKHYEGFSLFRYDNLFTEGVINESSKLEFENLKKILH